MGRDRSEPSERDLSPDAVTVAVESDTDPGLEERVLLQRARARLLGREDQPIRVGRYVVVGKLGAGSMGLVLRAYDPKLRREVALKVLRPRAGVDAEEAEGRLLREAQALARLNHPNVVSVFDAEKAEGAVCIAMEYVEGQTMRAWLGEHGRSWPEVLPVVLAIAHGLAAAHTAGLVHRDVKPENVLVAADGRVLLTDFGLARAAPDSQSSWSGPDVEEGDETLTKVGSVMGTPVYMAPEQHAGVLADARTDQYALGVLLWESLHRERPFRGPGAEALVRAKERGPPSPPSSRVPRWLHAVSVRALAVRPEDRWPSVAAIADALASGRGRVRRRRVLLVAAAAALAGAGVLVQRELAERNTIAACRDEGAAIHGEVWSADTRERLEAAFSAGPSYAKTTLAKVLARAQWYAEQWEATRTEVCVAAEVEHRLTPELRVLANECLDDHRDGLAALLDVLAEGGEESVQRATAAVFGLPPLEQCTDPDRLRRRPRAPEDPELRERSMALRLDLQRAKGLANAGRYDDSLALLQEIEQAATGLDALALETASFAGGIADFAGRYDEAETRLRRAFVDAGQLGLDEIAADSATRLVVVVGDSLARHGEGIAYADAAKVLVSRIEPEGEGPRHVRLLDALAGVQHGRGDDAEAERLYRESLAMSEAALGEDHPTVATQSSNLAGVLQARGAYDEAERSYARTIAISEAALGPDHPDIAVFLSNLAVVHMMREDHAAAVPLLERALAIQEAALGPDHVALAWTLNNLGAAKHQLGAHDDAERLLSRSLAIRERAVGPDHPTVATTLLHLGRARVARGRHAEAIAPLERALTLLSHADARPEHREKARFALARALWSADIDRARALALAHEARDALLALGDDQRDARSEVDAWLAEHDDLNEAPP